jgi:non-heme chloroperoxidase
VDPGFVCECQRGTVHRPVPQEFMDRVVSESLKLPARIWKAVLSGMLRPGRNQPLDVPALIIWGGRDPYFPLPQQHELQQRIAGATLRVFREAGHAPHWEAPEECARLLIHFMNPVEGRTKGEDR